MLPVTSSRCAGAGEVGTLLRHGARFDTFAKLVERSGAEVSRAAPPFAPTDEAFQRLPRSLVAEMKSHTNSEAVEQIVRLNMVASRPHASDDLPVEKRMLADTAGLGRLVTTYSLAERTLQVAPPEGTGELSVLLRARAANEARVVLGRVAAGDGVIVPDVDRVPLPPGCDEVAFEGTASEVRIDARHDTAGSANDLSRATGEGQNAGIRPDQADEDLASEIVGSNAAPLSPAPEPDPAGSTGLDADDPAGADRDAVDQATPDAVGGAVAAVTDGGHPTAEIAGASAGGRAARQVGDTDRNAASDGTPDTTVTSAPQETARALAPGP